jgi:hypothetical protein
MAALAGRGGKVMIGAAAVAFVESWTMDIADEFLNTTGLGAATATGIGRGLPATTFAINWKAMDQSDTATGAILTAAQANATGVTLLLYVDGTKYYTSAASSAFITGLSTGATVDGLVTGSASGAVSGKMTYT